MAVASTVAPLIEEVDCPLCGGRRYSVLREARYPEGLNERTVGEFYSASSDELLFDQLVRCDGCELIYLNPRIREDLILASYGDAEDPTFVTQNQQRIRSFKRSFSGLLRRQGLPPAGARVLDVGCAGGAFPEAANQLGCDVVGVEPSRWLSEHARATYGLDIRTGVLQDQELAPESFDVVTLWDVIEHLTQPRAVLGCARELLKSSGLLVVNFPDWDGLMRRVLRDRWPFLLSVHLVYFSPETLKRFLWECGFEVIEVRPYFQTLELGYVLKRAEPYAPLTGLARRVVTKLGLDALPFTYNLAQSQVVARKRLW